MSTVELKLSLHKLIEGIDDNSALSAVYAFLSGNKHLPASDRGNELSANEEREILIGLTQAKEGKTKSHQQIKDKHRQKFPHLKL